MATPAEIRAHQEWLGFLQPVGLVVSPTALVSAQAQVDRNIAREQETLKALVREDEGGDDGTRRVWLPDLPAFFSQFLGWEPGDLAGGPGGPEVPPTLDVSSTRLSQRADFTGIFANSRNGLIGFSRPRCGKPPPFDPSDGSARCALHTG